MSIKLFKLSKLFHNMNSHLILLALMLLPSFTLLDTIQGNLSLTLPSYCTDVVLSPDGNTLACVNIIQKNIELYANTGYSFELNHTINITDYPNNTQISNDAQTFYVCTITKFLIMKKGSNGTYETTVEVTLSSPQYFDIS